MRQSWFKGRQQPASALLLLLAFAWLVFRALANPVDHDIDQYVGGAMVVADGQRLFVDALHLQTPLQAWLWSPFVLLARPHAFLFIHLLPVLCGLAMLAIVARTTRTHGTSVMAALAAAALMLLSEAFQYAVTTLRNDALPALIGVAALAFALRAVRGERNVDAVLAGLCWGLAASGKISHLVVAAFGGGMLILLAIRHQLPWRVPLFAAAGGALGLLPAAIAYAAAPDAFWWGVIDFARQAPFAWNELNGMDHRLTLVNKLRIGLSVTAEGPALVALILLVTHRVRGHRPDGTADHLLDALIIGGLVAAFMPTPVQRGYFLPMLPPLFIRLAPLLDQWRRLAKRWPLVLLGLGAAIGLVRLPVLVALASSRGWPAIAVEREARWIGAQLDAAGVTGPIATLSPRFVLDSGQPLDPRFATGVFVFRTGNLLSNEQAQRFNVATPATMGTMFRARPPAAIVTGYEGGRPNFPANPDAVLVDWARSAGWRAIRSPHGKAVLFIPDRMRQRSLP